LTHGAGREGARLSLEVVAAAEGAAVEVGFSAGSADSVRASLFVIALLGLDPGIDRAIQ
jgi:hypothetical protein